ncbi:MAG: hypothetical protein BroJett029_23820 [Alphaproteobacteria bacterium]|nr:MAG: hypothetical protein BroJett029_23820 [Alphaproteobacteria bacterium]
MALSGIGPPNRSCPGVRIGYHFEQEAVSRGRVCWVPAGGLARSPSHREKPLAFGGHVFFVVEQAIELPGAPFSGAASWL